MFAKLVLEAIPIWHGIGLYHVILKFSDTRKVRERGRGKERVGEAEGRGGGRARGVREV